VHVIDRSGARTVGTGAIKRGSLELKGSELSCVQDAQGDGQGERAREDPPSAAPQADPALQDVIDQARAMALLIVETSRVYEVTHTEL
jgi:hypothetical protein